MEKWMRQAYEDEDKGMGIPEKLTPSRPKELLISSNSNKELHLASAEQIEPAKQRKGRSPKNTENRSADEVEEFNDNRSMTELLSGNSTKTLSRLKEILDMVAEDLNREAIEKSEKQPLEHTKRQKPFQYTTTAATLLPDYSAASGDLHLGGMFVNESLSIVNEAKRSSSDAEQTSELGLNSPSQGEADDLKEEEVLTMVQDDSRGPQGNSQHSNSTIQLNHEPENSRAESVRYVEDSDISKDRPENYKTGVDGSEKDSIPIRAISDYTKTESELLKKAVLGTHIEDDISKEKQDTFTVDSHNSRNIASNPKTDTNDFDDSYKIEKPAESRENEADEFPTSLKSTNGTKTQDLQAMEQSLLPVKSVQEKTRLVDSETGIENSHKVELGMQAIGEAEQLLSGRFNNPLQALPLNYDDLPPNSMIANLSQELTHLMKPEVDSQPEAKSPYQPPSVETKPAVTSASTEDRANQRDGPQFSVGNEKKTSKLDGNETAGLEDSHEPKHSVNAGDFSEKERTSAIDDPVLFEGESRISVIDTELSENTSRILTIDREYSTNKSRILTKVSGISAKDTTELLVKGSKMLTKSEILEKDTKLSAGISHILTKESGISTNDIELPANETIVLTKSQILTNDSGISTKESVIISKQSRFSAEADLSPASAMANIADNAEVDPTYKDDDDDLIVPANSQELPEEISANQQQEGLSQVTASHSETELEHSMDAVFIANDHHDKQHLPPPPSPPATATATGTGNHPEIYDIITPCKQA